MGTKRTYQRCGLNGVGKAHRIKDGSKINFSVIDISAAGFKMNTDTALEEGERLEVELHFSGIITEMVIKAKAQIVRKEQGLKEAVYSLSFEGLSEKEKVEIDEIISFSCIKAEWVHEG